MTDKKFGSIQYAMMAKAKKSLGASVTQVAKAKENMRKANFFPESWKEIGLIFWYLKNVMRVDDVNVDTAISMSSPEAKAVEKAFLNDADEAEQRLSDEETARLARLVDDGEWS